MWHSISKAMGIQWNPNSMILTDFRKKKKIRTQPAWIQCRTFHKARTSYSSEVPMDKMKTCSNSLLHPSSTSSFSGHSQAIAFWQRLTSEYSGNKTPVLKVPILLSLTQNCQGYASPLVSSKTRLTKIEANVEKYLHWEKYTGWHNYNLSRFSPKLMFVLLYVHLCIAVHNNHVYRKTNFLHRLLYCFIYITYICVRVWESKPKIVYILISYIQFYIQTYFYTYVCIFKICKTF